MISETKLNIIILGSLLSFSLVASFFDQPYLITLATKISILGLAAVGLNFILGFSGLVSFGHAAFFGVGGYVAGILASHALNFEPLFTLFFVIEGTTNLLIIWPAALLISGLTALFIGYFSLRTTGVYFIMITLAFAQMLYYFAISWPSYGGEDGLPVYVRGQLFGLNLMDGLTFFLVAYFWLTVGILISLMIVRSPFGLSLRACKRNYSRVASVGINPFRVQLTAFVISGAFTGLAGALYTDLNRFVSPSVLGWQMSGELIVFIIIGGVGRLCGPLLGAAFFVAFEHFFGSITEHWQILLGGIILCTLLFFKGGIIGFFSKA
ncbi:MAG: branched-chain amino acid ABC transporter permease [Rhodobacteraceae bacterium]|mgnify:FL=1|nr:MAG: branched-chain amino acid ABC transporter permease [Paracoccaceae bacterium]